MIFPRKENYTRKYNALRSTSAQKRNWSERVRRSFVRSFAGHLETLVERVERSSSLRSVFLSLQSSPAAVFCSLLLQPPSTIRFYELNWKFLPSSSFFSLLLRFMNPRNEAIPFLCFSFFQHFSPMQKLLQKRLGMRTAACSPFACFTVTLRAKEIQSKATVRVVFCCISTEKKGEK